MLEAVRDSLQMRILVSKSFQLVDNVNTAETVADVTERYLDVFTARQMSTVLQCLWFFGFVL